MPTHDKGAPAMPPAMPLAMDEIELLRRLVAFPTVSRDTNLPLLDWVEAHLAPHAPRTRRFPSPDGTKANLLLSFGPDEPGGLLLSGHTDVVPVDGQSWTGDPWTLREVGTRLVGRGATDMKGFLACMLALVPRLSTPRLSTPRLPALRRPVHLALSYDEEVGCTGVGPMAAWAGEHLRPGLAVIGEPSELKLVNAHKGGLIGWAHVAGRPGHSSQPDRAVNAVMAAARCVTYFDDLLAAFRAGPHDNAFDPPWSTCQVNRMEGGEGLNISAGHASFFWEMRLLPGQDDHAALRTVQDRAAAELLPGMQSVDPATGVRWETTARIPALAPCERDIESRLLHLLGQNAPAAVPYGSEAGLFQEAGTPAIILGPGNIREAHQPDEWIERSQLAACMGTLDRLVAGFCQ